MDPLDLGRGVALRLALEGHGLALGCRLAFGLLGEVGLRVDLELDGVAFGDADPVASLAGVVSLVIEVHVLDHQSLAIVVVSRPALRQRAALFGPSVTNRVWRRRGGLKINVSTNIWVKNQTKVSFLSREQK